MFWHIENGIVGLVAPILVLLRTHDVYHRGNLHNRLFLGCAYAIIAATALDILSGLVLDYPCSVALSRTVMTLYYLVLLSPCALWFAYGMTLLTENSPHEQRLFTIVGLVRFVLFELFVIANIWTGWLFSYSSAGEYVHGPLINVAIILPFIYLFAMLLLSIIWRKRDLSKIYHLVLLLVPVLSLAGLLMQLLFAGWLTAYPFMGLALLIAYMFIEDDKTRSEQQQRELTLHDLEQKASTEAMTGCLNRATAEARIRETLVDGRLSCMMIADIDCLKAINDTLGHANGDRAIIGVADTLKVSFRSTDIIARIGGDEFMIFLPGFGDETLISAMLTRLVNKLGELRVGESGSHAVSCSIGAVIGSLDYDRMYRQADRMLYQAKNGGKSTFSITVADGSDTPVTA